MLSRAVPLIAFILAVSSSPHASPTMQKPLTPGEVVMLANTARSDAPHERLKRAISDQNPVVRATAARVAGTLGLKDLAPSIAEALPHESVLLALTEQMRALLFLQGAAAGPLLQAHLDRGGPTAALLLAEWLGRVHPEQFAFDLPILLRKVSDQAVDLGRLVQMAAIQHPSFSDQLARAWRDAAPPIWGKYLEGAMKVNAVSDTVLIEALESSDAELRRATVWGIVRMLGTTSNPSAATIDAAVAASDKSPTNQWETFGRELIARRYRNAAAVDRTDLINQDGHNYLDDVEMLLSVSDLTQLEQQAVRALLQSARRPIRGVPFRRRVDSPTVSSAASLASMPWPGLLESVMNATGCRSNNDGAGAATVFYAVDGSPQNVVIHRGRQGRQCEAAVTALAQISVAEIGQPIRAGFSEWLAFPFNPDSTKCLDMPRTDIRRVPLYADKSTPFKAPKLLRDVPPVYPESARREGVTGNVIIEAVITTTGCVAAAHVTQSATSLLDVAALDAVSGWRFDPAAEGELPVSTSVILNIGFSLR